MDTLQFSTSDIDACERPNAIEHTFSNYLFMDIDIPENKTPSFSIKACLLPELSLTQLSGTPAKAVRTTEQASTSADDVILCITQHADVRIKKNKGKEKTFSPGTPHIWQADQRFICEVGGNYSTLMLSVPSEAYDKVGIDPERMSSNEFKFDTATINLLTGYTNTLIQEVDSLNQHVIDTAARHIRELAVIALASVHEAEHIDATQSKRAARLIAIKQDIDRNLAHPDLSLTWIAARAHISPRYLRDLFTLEQTNFTEYVVECRLIRAYKLLCDLQFFTHSISTIAYEVGFNDLSYFSRAFKRRFGEKPSDIRRRS